MSAFSAPRMSAPPTEIIPDERPIIMVVTPWPRIFVEYEIMGRRNPSSFVAVLDSHGVFFPHNRFGLIWERLLGVPKSLSERENLKVNQLYTLTGGLFVDQRAPFHGSFRENPAPQHYHSERYREAFDKPWLLTPANDMCLLTPIYVQMTIENNNIKFIPVCPSFSKRHLGCSFKSATPHGFSQTNNFIETIKRIPQHLHPHAYSMDHQGIGREPLSYALH